MAQRHLDLVHVHPTWNPRVKPEYTEDGRLHRHRLIEPGRAVRFTTWAHNTEAHQHRLPDGAFTRPRLDLNPPTWLLVSTPSGGQRYGEVAQALAPVAAVSAPDAAPTSATRTRRARPRRTSATKQPVE
jgi:hypothetical protein